MTEVDESPSHDDLPLDALTKRLEDEPLRLAILFGSHARGNTHASSDVDIAVELDGLRPGDDSYNDAFFGVSKAVSELLDTDDVDVVDIHSMAPSFAVSILREGTLLVGDPDRVETLLTQLTAKKTETRPPRERIDDALKRIDEHLA